MKMKIYSIDNVNKYVNGNINFNELALGCELSNTLFDTATTWHPIKNHINIINNKNIYKLFYVKEQLNNRLFDDNIIIYKYSCPLDDMFYTYDFLIIYGDKKNIIKKIYKTLKLKAFS